MLTTLSLRAAELHYPPDLQVHTAASGPISSLSARYLEIERSDGFIGRGEVRANISYLSHLPESAVDPAIHDLCRRLPWSAEPEEHSRGARAASREHAAGRHRGSREWLGGGHGPPRRDIRGAGARRSLAYACRDEPMPVLGPAMHYSTGSPSASLPRGFAI